MFNLAMPDMSRIFVIPASPSKDFTLKLHEPSLTADNLGMKTWVSSYLLSCRLHKMIESAPRLMPSASTLPTTENKVLRALELGAGTGLVGLSFAALQGSSTTIHLTDLPLIVDNLAHNVHLNSELLGKTGATVTTDILDWSITPERHVEEDERYDVVLAADSLYSPQHPKWLVDTVSRTLRHGPDGRFIIEIPLRDAYQPQVRELRERMEQIGLVVVDEGEEVGYDDWENAEGDAMEVRCWWSVWKWK